jgi:uncharacterized protein YdaU (DUF1376 family)
MNYYEHHIGDYDSATAHLSLVEDGVYRRLICICYRTEAPLPADLKAVCRLARAASKPERDAVQQVLSEFFQLEEDGWHNARCDADIARYKDGEPEREVKKANESNRLTKHREERARLFKLLTDAGQHAAWNIAMPDLRALVSKLPATGAETELQPLPATAPATPATATQTPDTRHQTPEIKEKGARPDATTLRALAEGTAEPENPAIGAGTRYGLAAKAMRQKGCAANPGDPRLRQLVDQGASLEEFEAVAAEAADKGKGAAWGLTALINRRKDAAEIRLAPAATAPAWQETREGVEAKARELGLAPWFQVEQDAIRRGTAPSWPHYRAHVIATAKERA